eukprot:COSAG01_NODE_10938_length_2043_cov_3.886831_2_plen_72_part_00
MLLIDLGWTGCSAQGKEQGYGMLLSPQEVGDRAARGDTLRPTLKVVNLKQEAGERAWDQPALCLRTWRGLL